MTALDIPLSTAEEAQLAECEETIGKGLQTFVEVGLALAKIRDGRLYRQTHTTFEAYCEAEWHLSRSRTYELIDAATVTDQMSAMADIPAPANARQARALSGLEPEVAAEVMQKVGESGEKLTAKSIAEAREEVAPKPPRFTKVRSEVMVDKETGEVVDADSTPTATMTRTAPRQPRTDVVLVMGTVINQATKAADAAERIKPEHLSNRNEEAATWHRDLSTQMQSLQRLLDALKEASQ